MPVPSSDLPTSSFHSPRQLPYHRPRRRSPDPRTNEVELGREFLPEDSQGDHGGEILSRRGVSFRVVLYGWRRWVGGPEAGRSAGRPRRTCHGTRPGDWPLHRDSRNCTLNRKRASGATDAHLRCRSFERPLYAYNLGVTAGEGGPRHGTVGTAGDRDGVCAGVECCFYSESDQQN